MFKQAKNIFLLAIIVLSTIAASFSFSSRVSASAIPSLYLDPQIENDAIASVYRTSLALCLTLDAGTFVGTDGDGIVSAQDISAGKWFGTGDLRVSYLVDKSSGGIGCSDLFNGRDVMGVFKHNSYIQFACDLGLTRQNQKDTKNISECVNGNGDFGNNITDNGGRDHVYAVLDGLHSNAIGQTGPVESSVNFTPLHGYTKEQIYVMAADTYSVACSATPVVNVADATVDQKNSGLVPVNVVDYQGNATQVFYSQGNNDKKKFRNKEDSFDYMDENCDHMRLWMVENGPAYQAWVKSHQPGQNGTPGTCDERYPPASDPTDNKACIDGFNNKNTANYCVNTYATTDQFLQDERAACIYGATVATGGAGTTGAPPPTPTGSTTSKPTCAITGVGWIICPIMNNFLAPAVDAAYGFVSAMLTVQPLMTTGGAAAGSTDTYASLYNAWSVMRNFANIMFVIAFIFIIFSQLTSIGISNYGIKKMLPRIIMGAILVNLSFWICAVAVDVSNILGTSMNGLFNGMVNSLASQSSNPSVFSTGAGWVGITATVLAGVGVGIFVLYIGLAALLPVLIFVLMTIITTVVALSIRQALIVMLVAASPLIALGYIFPGTEIEGMSKKGVKLFRELLEMFPVIAVIFGGSKLASVIIMNTAPTDKDYAIAFQIIGAGVGVFPLILTPIFMKGASSLVGKVMNNGGRGVSARLNKKADNFRDRREGQRAINALNGNKNFGMGKYQRQAKRNARDAGIQNELKRAQAGYVAQQVIANPKLANKLAGGTAVQGASSAATTRALSNAIKTEADIEADEIKAASLVISHLNLTQPQLQELSLGRQAGGLDGGNAAVQAAAMRSVVDAHNVAGVNHLLDAAASGGLDERARKNLADALQSSSQRPGYVGMGDIENIRQHGKTSTDASGNPITIQAESSTQLALNAVEKNSYSVEKLANGDQSELNFVANTVGNSLGTPDAPSAGAMTQFTDNAKAALTDPKYSGQVSKNRNVIDTISRL